jgi:hypothetical protein
MLSSVKSGVLQPARGTGPIWLLSTVLDEEDHSVFLKHSENAASQKCRQPVRSREIISFCDTSRSRRLKKEPRIAWRGRAATKGIPNFPDVSSSAFSALSAFHDLKRRERGERRENAPIRGLIRDDQRLGSKSAWLSQVSQ